MFNNDFFKLNIRKFYVSGNATRTHEQLPNHNILPLFQFQ